MPAPTLSLEAWELLWSTHTAPFLRALTGNDDAAEVVPFCWQTTDDPKTGRHKGRHLTGPLPHVRVELITAQAQSGGVFVTVNETDGQGRAARNITRARAIWADIDHSAGVTWDGSALHFAGLDAPVPVPLPPSIVVRTQKGFHLYWLTLPDVSLEAADDLLWWACVWCRGDAASRGIGRVLRVPGFFHQKHDPPFLIQMESCDRDLVYDLATLRAAFPEVSGRPKPVQGPVLVEAGPVDITADETAWAIQEARAYLLERPGAVEGASGDAHTYATASRVLDWVTEEAAAFALLQEWNLRTCTPAWSDVELLAKLRHAATYRKQAAGAEVVLERHMAGLREVAAPAAVPAPAAAAAGGGGGGVVLQFPASPGVAPPAPRAPTDDVTARALAGMSAYLVVNDKGKPLACVNNASVFLKWNPAWASVFRFNLFRHTVDLVKPLPVEPGFLGAPYTGQIRDNEVTQAAMWMARNGLDKISSGQVMEAIAAVAMANPYHPVEDYLRGLQWDGVPRVDSWLATYCHAQTSDPHRPRLGEYVSLAGRFWLISAVARILRFRTGSKVQTMLILEGEQGTNKSSLFPALMPDPEWFSDAPINVLDKDTLQNMLGVWVWEMAELAELSRADAASMKTFLTQQTNRFRAPYAKHPEIHQRQSVLCGTYNVGNQLPFKDETGGRRFLPVLCQGHVDLESIRRDRDQLWAEAVVLHDAGHPWWPSQDQKPAFEWEQEERLQVDPWEDKVVDWSETFAGSVVAMSYVLEHVLELSTDRQDTGSQKRAAGCLRAAGWDRGRDSKGRKAWKRVNKTSII